jgi:A/G-specific adenine glycosylase
MDESETIRKRLLSWYRKNQRDMPWRKTVDPYRIWISEIMLQQTRVDTVIPYYRRFLKRFPDVHALAEAHPDEVIKLWENLGYYSRARNLHAAAKIIVEKHGGRFPEDPKAVLALPGIGAYTTGAVLSIAFGKHLPAIDGNVRRVVARLYAVESPITETQTQRNIARRVETLVPARNPGDFNQALMDLGATICLPGDPHCRDCPVAAICKALADDSQSRIPLFAKKKPIPLRQAAAGFILDKKKRFLIVQRTDKGLLGRLWKLPGGFQSDRETLVETLKRTVLEETGIVINAGEAVAVVNHTFTHFRMRLHGFWCIPVSGRIRPPDGITYQWIEPDERSRFAFAKADRELLHRMVVLFFP